jgi:hypothetical protein
MAYSDYHGSDSDSGEGAEVYHRSPHPHKLKSKAAKARLETFQTMCTITI